MLLDLLDGQALVRLPHQDPLDQVPALGADARVLWEPVVHAHDPIQHLAASQALLRLSASGTLMVRSCPCFMRAAGQCVTCSDHALKLKQTPDILPLVKSAPNRRCFTRRT